MARLLFGVLSRFNRFYNTNFERRPVVTLIITNGVLMTISDVLAQSSDIYFSKQVSSSYDFERTLRFAVYGMGMGPIIGRWLRILERGVPMAASGKGNTVALVKRVLLDQVVMAPLGLFLFVSSMGIMEGKGPDEISQKFKDVFVPAILANWKVWPIIQGINFKLVPLQYRLPFQSTCGIGWVLYLSLLNAREERKYTMSEA